MYDAAMKTGDRKGAILLLGVILLSTLGGCGTINNLKKSPQFYGGVRHVLQVTKGLENPIPDANEFILLLDLIASFILDTILLPVIPFIMDRAPEVPETEN